ncbi:MAG: hypothetical protein NPIRA03_07420 [Nitrospirales bacterium]|nr:MAG: hypothetical protein NPIRA03_07420 [Nitrospirales bacterium]
MVVYGRAKETGKLEHLLSPRGNYTPIDSCDGETQRDYLGRHAIPPLGVQTKFDLLVAEVFPATPYLREPLRVEDPHKKGQLDLASSG